MHEEYSKIRIFDLDSIILNGMSNSTFYYKLGKESLKFGGIYYLSQLLAEYWQSNITYVGVCRNLDTYDINELCEYSLKDPLTRLQYEIIYERLEMCGIKLIKCDSDNEIETQLLKLVSDAENNPVPFSYIKVYTNREILNCSVKLNPTIIVIGNEAVVKGASFKNVGDFQLKLNNYLFYYLAKKLPNGLELAKEFNEISKGNIRDTDTVTQVIVNKLKVQEIDQDSALDFINTYASILKILCNNNGTDWNLYDPEYNTDGFKIWLQMLQMTSILEYLRLSETWSVPKSTRSWLINKVNSYLDGRLSVKNNLPLQTDYFVNVEEKIDRNNRDAEQDLGISQFI